MVTQMAFSFILQIVKVVEELLTAGRYFPRNGVWEVLVFTQEPRLFPIGFSVMGLRSDGELIQVQTSEFRSRLLQVLRERLGRPRFRDGLES